MDPKRVLTFRAVAHERSFSRAARQLALSQPSVSNQVGALEREIGARLLDRQPGGLRLTREGEILLEHADAIAERFQLADAQLAVAAHGQRTRLRIGAFPTALAGLVPAAIARLRERYPDTKVSVDEGGDDDLPARVRSGELHLALGFQDTAQPRHQPPGLERRDLLQEHFMVALAPDHRLAQRPEVRLADLSDDEWTAASTDGLIVRACQAAGFTPNLVSITHDQLAIRALIDRGLAVTLAPQLLADAFTDLTLRPIAGTSPARDVYALLPPGARHPLVAPTLDALHATAAQLITPTDAHGLGVGAERGTDVDLSVCLEDPGQLFS
jgi:DNA-binding transcriptional LysR family regulator